MTTRRPSSAQRLLIARNVLTNEMPLWREEFRAARDVILVQIDRELEEKGWVYVKQLARWYRKENIRALRHLSA